MERPPGAGPTGASDPLAPVEAVFRAERGRLLAALAVRLGDLDLAEEVSSHAFEVALIRWPDEGLPDHPFAWLLATGRRRAIDLIRRDRTLARRLARLQVEAERGTPVDTDRPDAVTDAAPPVLRDDVLTLFFTCCHPALPVEAQVALTLRCLAGLTTEEVAEAFLVPVPTMAQRIVRAKRKIRDAGIPFRVPEGDELRHRLPVVLRVVYLVFTEGYAASSGAELLRTDLADEAVRLARFLHRALPAEPEVTGLLALLLLTDARRAARVGADGALVPLEEADRTLWDAVAIAEGTDLVPAALAGGGPYALQAAIAALHAEAPDVDRTDWPQVVALYDVLLARTASPVVAVNRAVAVAMRDGPVAGLVALDALAATDGAEQVCGRYAWHVARAELLRRAGRSVDAADAYRAALDLAGNAAERTHLGRRLAEVTAGEIIQAGP